MNNISSSTPSFTARCTQIRDAQWVCHTVNTALPHRSTSKLFPLFNNVLVDYLHPFFNFKIENMHQLSCMLDKLTLRNKDFDNLSIFQKITKKIHFLIQPQHKKKDRKLLIAIRNFSNKFGDARLACQGEADPIYKVLNMLEHYKLGNCYEDAKTAELILQMNNIKNTRTAFLLKNGHVIDHCICLFNKDGTKFDSKLKKGNTIIIDPWSQKADFVENMELFYKNLMKEHFNIQQHETLSVKPILEFTLNNQKLYELRQRFPQFIFPIKNRKFMQNEKP